MAYQFYKSEAYRSKQSNLTKKNWESGVFSALYKKDKRICKRDGCWNIFETILSDPKKYCSRSCAAMVNNVVRGEMPPCVRLKISKQLMGKSSPSKGILKVPRVTLVCANKKCEKLFIAAQWACRKFCSTQCAMDVIGGRPTSPKAARGVAGVRDDIGQEFYFYSRWEANFARILNLLGIPWQYQCRTFDIGEHMYTPDFYLPDSDTWIEIKNFLSDYSRDRDENFRKMYPDLELMLILKDEYLELQEEFAQQIEEWEFS
ncbi:hypothetical protein A2372_02645 [Candidatus Wolfebacteria bacterium RIFOXYB1_FULL_54_12]|uniref:Nuclease associated modular domain-containing protein n=1 Tax=Candidatus Wolfebacteria bacterium RIFOXYB1_FULL_54_12 TaxID=1802559 RepID=A0A1F8DZT6_9BACT|nr:MAG: hypothetical protein A2372_02645 [Candidatus Wolfebacteria bacterium RIFOXYB1_FULL_54_12]